MSELLSQIPASSTLSLARVRPDGNGRTSHASPGESRVAILGSRGSYLFATILEGLKRLVFYHPEVHTVSSSLGTPEVTRDGSLAVALVRPEEILCFGLRGQGPGRNNARAVLAF